MKTNVTTFPIFRNLLAIFFIGFLPNLGSSQNVPVASADPSFFAGYPALTPMVKPVMYSYGIALTPAECYLLDTLTRSERQFIESSFDPPMIGIVRDLAVPVHFTVKKNSLPASGDATISGGRLNMLNNDTATWTALVKSEKADELRLYFSSGNIPNGVKVHLFSKDGYAFHQSGLRGQIGPDGYYTTTTFADHVILQLVIPIEQIEELDFTITKVVHSDNRYLPQAPLTCYEDVNCAYANGYANIDDLRRSTAKLSYVKSGGNYICTGGLLNDNRAEDWQPFLLTANHCFSTQASATSLECRFDYRTTSCNGSVNTSIVITNGAGLIATNSQSDFTLVLLNEYPSGSRYFQGWTTGSVANDATLHSVHHPSGIPQKYTRHQKKSSPTYECDGFSTSNFHYSKTLGGMSQPGSSGGNVSNASGYVVGQLYGWCHPTTWDLCDYNTFNDMWGRFDVSYSNNNLQYWLSAGAGASVAMSSSPSSSYSYGTINVGSYSNLTVTVYNTGTVPNYMNLSAGTATISGTNAGEFSIIGATSLYLSPGTSGTFTVRFTPASPGMKTANFNIPHNADNTASPRVITLTGYGNPCSDIITLSEGIAGTETFSASGTGVWYTSTNTPCGDPAEGVEQVYSFTPSVSGIYKIQVTSTNSTNVIYMWKSGSCSSSGWSCIGDIYANGTYGSMNMTAGTTYYLLLDDKYTSSTTHDFYIFYDPCSNISNIAGAGAGYSKTYPGGGYGIWYTSSQSPCTYYCYGREQVYSFTPSVTGLYSIVVTAASGYVDYMLNTSCSSSGWSCIDDIIYPGTYGSFLWTAGTTYYILLDDENSTAGAHTFYVTLAEAAGTWEGTVSSDWTDPANWSANLVPDATIDVTIPGGTPNQPIIGPDVNAYTHDLTIQTGAILTQNGTTNNFLDVFGNLNSDGGQFTMTGISFLYFSGSESNYWDDDNENDTYTNVRVDKSSSTAQTTMWQNMTCSGTFEIREGIFAINATWKLTVTNTGTSAFEVEDGGKLNLTDESIDCAGRVRFYDGSQAAITGGTIECGGDFMVDANTSHDIGFAGGTLVMKGSGNTYINDLDGGNTEFYNITVNKTSGTCYIQSADLFINNDLSITGGTLSCNNGPSPTTVFNIYIAGDWSNTVGVAGFEESTATVIFNGNTHQYSSDETFNIIDVNKSAGALRMNGTNVICNQYEWTAGAVDVLSGSFTANDLADNGLFGNYYVNPGGTINLTNNDGWVDLAGSVYIIGGNFNIWGGLGWDSYWPWSADGYIEMSGGTLDIKDVGVIIGNSMWNFTENITGGTIRTARGFYIYRSEFTPTGGTIEFYGPTNGDFHNSGGGFVHNILINKGVTDNPPKYPGIRKIRDGETVRQVDAPMANTITTISSADINGNVTINGGIFSLGSQTINVAGDWTNNAGTAGFDEGTGTVVFDGSAWKSVLTPETFYNLMLNKTFGGFGALELNGDVTVNNALQIVDGNLELNTPTNLYVNGPMTISLDAGLNANDLYGPHIYIRNSWTNNNTAPYTSVIGFEPGQYSTVHFDGSADQVMTNLGSGEFFANLVIDKSGGKFKPANNTTSTGNIEIVQGTWEDNISSLTHSVYGNFTVNTSGFFSTAVRHNTVSFLGTGNSILTYSGTLGYFHNILVDKTVGSSVTQIGNTSCQQTGDFTVNAGSYNLNGYNLLVTGDININSPGTLALPASSVLILLDGKTLNVNSGGVLNISGTPGDPVTIQTNLPTSHFTFNVNSGGTIGAEYGIFENMGANGVNIQNGAFVDPLHPFTGCTFQDGASAGTLLTINNAQTMTIRGAVFPTNSWLGSSNVSKTMNHGHVYFVDFTGDYSGEVYDNDPFGRVTWVPTLTAAATATPGIVCAGNSSQLNTIRTGGQAPFSYLWSPSTGLSDPAISNPVATPPATTNYTVTVTDALGTTAAGSVTVTVWPLAPAGVTIAASANPSPPGNFVTFTAIPLNGGASPAYQWKVNGLSVGTGLPTYSYIPLNGDVITCILTSSYLCATGNPATSNAITMIVVNTNASVTGTVPSPLSLCFDASNTITVAGSGSSFLVSTGASVNLIAGVRILIYPTTTVQSGGYLHGYITTTNSYCGSLPPSMVNVIAGNSEPMYNIADSDLFSIYPNPTTGKFFLVNNGKEPSGTVNLEIFTIKGERVFVSSLFNESRREFDLANLPNGLYLVKVMKDQYLQTFKLIIFH